MELGFFFFFLQKIGYNAGVRGRGRGRGKYERMKKKGYQRRGGRGRRITTMRGR